MKLYLLHNSMIKRVYRGICMNVYMCNYVQRKKGNMPKYK